MQDNFGDGSIKTNDRKPISMCITDIGFKACFHIYNVNAQRLSNCITYTLNLFIVSYGHNPTIPTYRPTLQDMRP